MKKSLRKRIKMNDITVNPENVELLSIEISELIDDYRDVLKTIKHNIESIQEENIWNGSDFIQFKEASEKYLNSFQDVETNLNFYEVFLKRVGIIYQTLEQDYSDKGIHE